MIRCENLIKIYKASDIEVVALQGLDLVVDDGELMAIIGNSGSGKSTLLNILGGLDRPTAGSAVVNGKDLLKIKESELIKYKTDTVGFVWQNNARNLIPYLTALENIEIPMLLSGKQKRGRALELLELVGMSHRKNNRLSQLSGGEQQRVAIAIALANSPKLLLADEPTGAVDTKTSSQILDVFRKINRELGVTIVIVTHDMQLSKKVDRVVAIRDGRTSSEFIRKTSYLKEFSETQGFEKKEEDEHEETHDELVVVDKAGRLQIPREYLDSIGLSEQDKLMVRLEGKDIILRNSSESLQR